MSAPRPDAWPRSFGRYTLLAPLAQGGMGDVCIALSGSVMGAERLVVLKTIRTDLAGDKEFVGRFLDEGRVVCALSHPNIAQVMEVGTEADVPYLAMEFVAGEDLDRVIQAAQRSNATLSVDFALTAIAGVLEGLSYAHRARALDGRALQIVHRDISPQNVRVGWDGDVKILDFGAARADVRETRTAHGIVFGKPGYMSPEQACGDVLDARTDLFATGVVMWELLAGSEIEIKNTTKYMQEVASGRFKLARLSPTRADVPPTLDAWIDRMTQYERDDRFPDAASARKALLTIARDHRMRVERDAVVETLGELLNEERESSRSYVTSLVARGRATREGQPASSPPPPVRRAPAAAAPSDEGVIQGTRYRAGDLLGSGGMGEVFAAEHADLGRKVAIKILYPEHSYNPGIAQRFRMEARAIASLSHPNLVHVYDFGETADGRLFYAMERLDGETLRARIDAKKRLEPADAVRIGAAVAHGLTAAHAAGVIHRDLKPENIFLVTGGAIKLLDFGVAKAMDSSTLGGKYDTRSLAGEVFGSPGYISPEQGTGRPVDARTDVYSLGAVLYEALVGARVFEGGTMVEVLARHLAEPPPPMASRAPDARVPPELEKLVMDCLAKDPGARPQTAVEVAARLDAIAATLGGPAPRVVTKITASAPPPPPSSQHASPPSTARTPTPSPPPTAGPVITESERPGRSPALVGGAIGLALALMGSVIWFARSNSGDHDTVATTRADTTALATPDAATQGTHDPVVPPTPTPPVPAIGPTPPVVVPTVTTGLRSPVVLPHNGSTRPAITSAGANAHPGTPGPTPVANAAQTLPSQPTPTVTPPAVQLSHYERAVAALQARQLNVAVDEATASISARERVLEARTLLGQVYLRQGQHTQAVTQWRMVLARDAANPRARELLRAAGEDPDAP